MRITIKDTNPGVHVPSMPENADIIGEIVRPGDGGTGALVLTDDWEFIQISDGTVYKLNQKHVYTAIIKAILNEFFEEQVDLAIRIGYSLDTIKSWSCGRRVPTFGTIKMLITILGITTER